MGYEPTRPRTMKQGMSFGGNWSEALRMGPLMIDECDDR